MDTIVNIHLILLHKENKQPVTGSEYRVKFYDKDFLDDDFLGESSPDTNGHTILSITRDDFQKPEKLREKYPDLYFVVFKNDQQIFRSSVSKNLQLTDISDFPATDGVNHILGTFLV